MTQDSQEPQDLSDSKALPSQGAGPPSTSNDLERLVEVLTREYRKDRSRRRWFRLWSLLVEQGGTWPLPLSSMP